MLKQKIHFQVAAIQHSIVLPTNASIRDQRTMIFSKIEEMIEKAAALGVNIVCLPECWSKYTSNSVKKNQNNALIVI